MKFLEIESLDVLNNALDWENGEARVMGRIEAYSCKTAGTDKKLFKQLEQRYSIVDSVSPYDDNINTNTISPFGSLNESTPRKTLFYLVATLNALFPEHDFSDINPNLFTLIPSVDTVINSVNTTLFNLGNESVVDQYRIWDTIDELVDFSDCEVYHYQPEVDDDPTAEEDGFLWSMNYFFFSRKLKRIVFFSLKSER